MPNITPELGLAIAVDSDDTATYLETNLGGSLTTVDSLFNASSGHTHSGAHQGGPITSAGVADGSITNAKLGPDVARANQLTNGGFEIWQRGNGPFTLSGQYCADRWIIGLSGTDALSVSRNTANADVGSAVCAALTFTNAGGGNTLISQQYPVTEFPQLAGRPLSLSVRVSTTVANAVRLGLYNGSAWSYSAYHPGSGGYQTLTIPNITPSGSGTVFVAIYVANASCTAYVDNACLVVGSQPANYVPLHPADDLARCLRYFETIGDDGDVILGGLTPASPTSPTAFATVSFKARKAVTPTITFVGGAWTAVNITGGGPVINAVGRGSARLNLGSAGPASGTYYVASDTTHYITAESNP